MARKQKVRRVTGAAAVKQLRRSYKVALLTLGVAVGAGCTLLTPLGDYAGSAVAGADAADEPLAADDAGLGIHDAPTTPDDSGRDGGTTFDPCIGATFCDRFERTTSLQGPWDYLSANAGATFGLDTSTWASPTTSLAVALPSVGGASAQPNAQLTVSYPNVDHARISVATKVDSPARFVILLYLAFEYPTAQGRHTALYQLASDATGAHLSAFTNTPSLVDFEQYAVTGLIPNLWQRWTYEIDGSGMQTIATVTVDGSQVFQQTLGNRAYRGALSASLGPSYSEDGPPRKLYFDDFGLTIVP